MSKEEQVSHWHEWKGSINHSLEYHATEFEKLRERLHDSFAKQLAESSAKSTGLARVLVILLHFLRHTKENLSEFNRTRPFICGFIDRNIANFELIAPIFLSYVSSDDSLSDAEKRAYKGNATAWKDLLMSGKRIFDDGEDDDILGSSILELIDNLDTTCPDNVEEIQKEFQHGLISKLVLQEKARIRIELLSKLLFKSDELLDKMIDEEMERTYPDFT